MKISAWSASCRIRTPPRRALACVLLIGIIYAVTFGLAHSHGILSLKTDTNITTSAAVQANSSFLIPIQRPSHPQECLICLFHQQLFSSVVHSPLYIAKPSIQVAPVSPPRGFFYSSSFTSAPTTRLSGRAPPICCGGSVVRVV